MRCFVCARRYCVGFAPVGRQKINLLEAAAVGEESKEFPVRETNAAYFQTYPRRYTGSVVRVFTSRIQMWLKLFASFGGSVTRKGQPCYHPGQR